MHDHNLCVVVAQIALKKSQKTHVHANCLEAKSSHQVLTYHRELFLAAGLLPKCLF